MYTMLLEVVICSSKKYDLKYVNKLKIEFVIFLNFELNLFNVESLETVPC